MCIPEPRPEAAPATVRKPITASQAAEVARLNDEAAARAADVRRSKAPLKPTGTGLQLPPRG